MQVCTHSGKESFPSPQAAHATAQRIRGRGAYDAKAYNCPNCGHYHLSSQTPGSFAGKSELGTFVGQRKAPYKRTRVVWEGEE